MKREIAERRGRRGEGLAAFWLRLHGWRAAGTSLDTAIDAHRLQRVAAAVEAVGHRYARQGEDWRIDVLLLAPGHWPRHIVNAWQP